jgi:hypothetical protein
MFLVSLVFCSMRLGVPFIALRQPGAVGHQFGSQFLPSVEWCTRQSGAPPDSHCSSPVLDFFPYQVQPTVGPRDQLAQQIVRCAQPTVGADHVSHVDRADDRWPQAPLTHRTVLCTIGQSGELYPRRLFLFPRAAGSPLTSLGHRTLSGAPSDSPVCQA